MLLSFSSWTESYATLAGIPEWPSKEERLQGGTGVSMGVSSACRCSQSPRLYVMANRGLFAGVSLVRQSNPSLRRSVDETV